MLVPTFTYAFAVGPLPHQRPARNGWNYAAPPHGFSGAGLIYTTSSTDVDRGDMGAIPAAVAAMSGRARGDHPLCSFSAVGPLASDLVDEQAPLRVFAPLAALAARNGAVVIMGVGLDRITLLHLAERLAGRTLFRRWANDPDGRPMEVEVGGCSQGFLNLEPVLSPLGKSAIVGRSSWRVFPAQEILSVASEAIRRTPQITHCGRRGCDRCNDAVLGGPLLTSTQP